MHLRKLLLAVSTSVLALPVSLNAETIYATGFENPSLIAGQNLVGQDGWVVQNFGGSDLGPNAATISTAAPKTGLQGVQIIGSALTPTGVGYAIGSYRQFVNFDLAAAGFPIIRVEADVRIDGPKTEQTADRVTGDFFSANLAPFASDGYVGELSLSSDGHLYGYSASDSYLFGVSVSLGQYHHLALDLNFQTRTTTYLLDGQVLGTATFDPASTSNILSRGSIVAYSLEGDPLGRDASLYTAYFDNFSISSVPEPSSLMLAGLGVVGLLGRRYQIQRKSRGD